ncbi:MAG: GHKL domain-containing protein [Defluviitaleaceae bacterium]|nr:GHKL domain-containing protein [Defluviitaleaceae bacterium]
MEHRAVTILVGMFFTMFLVERYMLVFFNQKRTLLSIKILSYFLYPIFMTVIFTLNGLNLVSLLIHAVVLFAVSLNYMTAWAKRFAAVFTISSIEIILWYGLNTFFGINIFITMAIFLLLAFAIENYRNFKKGIIVLKVFWLSIFIFPASLAITVSMVLLYSDLPTHTQIFALSAIFGIHVFIVYLYDSLSKAYEDKLKSKLHAQEKEYYFAQCQLMQESVENIKSLRHDMKSHLGTAMNFIASNNANEATNYFNTLLGDIKKSEIYSNTGNIAFDSIINFKLNNIKHESMKLEIRLLIPPILNIETVDVVTILGNLLDNAFDAVSRVENKIVILDIEYSRNVLFIQVKNTFDGMVKYVNEAGEKSIITRKGEGEHGYGLKNIRKSVENYDGHVDISHEDNMFSVGALLYIAPYKTKHASSNAKIS